MKALRMKHEAPEEKDAAAEQSRKEEEFLYLTNYSNNYLTALKCVIFNTKYN